MMKPHLHLVEGSGLIERLEEYEPPDPEDVDMYITAHIGAEGGVGKDLFSFRLLTSKAFSKQLYAKRYVVGRGIMVVERFDFKFLWGLISAICDGVEEDSWEAIGDRLSRYMEWEMDPRSTIDFEYDWRQMNRWV